MRERHLLLNGTSIIEVEGQSYVPESKVSGLLGKEAVLPIHFVSSGKREVFHDTPVMGDTQLGSLLQDSIAGPFFSLEEAEKVLQERKEQVDRVSYDFFGKIVSRVLPVNDSLPSKIPIYKYYSEGCKLQAGEEPQALCPDYNISNAQVEALYKILKQRVEENAKEKKDFEHGTVKGLLAIIGTTLVRLILSEGTPFKRFTLNSLSDERQDWDYSSDLKELNIHPAALRKYHPSEFVGLSPVKFSVNYDSLDDVVKRNNLIF